MHILKKSIVYILSKIYYKLIKEFFVNLDKLIPNPADKTKISTDKLIFCEISTHQWCANVFLQKHTKKKKNTHTHI